MIETTTLRPLERPPVNRWRLGFYLLTAASVAALVVTYL